MLMQYGDVVKMEDCTDNLCVRYIVEHGKNPEAYDGYCNNLADLVADWAARKFGLRGVETQISLGGPCDVLQPACFVFNRYDEGGVAVRQLKGCKSWVWWSFHVVLVVDRVVHDYWFPELLPLEAYLDKNFGHHDPSRLLVHDVYQAGCGSADRALGEMNESKYKSTVRCGGVGG